MLVVIGITVSAGCREDVVTAPPIEYPFTLHGILNPKSNLQAVVVSPVQDRLRPIGAEPLDAVVTSTDLTTGEIRVWADSVVSDEAAGYSHVYWSDFRVEFGRSYRIEAVRSDGAGSSVIVKVPMEAAVEVQEPASRSRDVWLHGTGFRVISAIVTYNYVSEPNLFTFPIDYTFKLTERDGAWTLNVWFEEYSSWLNSWCRSLSMGPQGSVGNEHGSRRTPESVGKSVMQCSLMRVTVDVTIVDEAWQPPTDVSREPPRIPELVRDLDRHPSPLFDRDAMAHPGGMTNVENGFGFVGAGYRQRIDLRL